jgi:CBS domain-containing protein
LSVEAARLVERVRTLPLARLARADEPGGATRADVVRALAQRLADVAAALEGRPARVIPVLSDEYAADQVAVTAGDLVAAVASRDDLSDAERSMVVECAEALHALRLEL